MNGAVLRFEQANYRNVGAVSCFVGGISSSPILVREKGSVGYVSGTSQRLVFDGAFGSVRIVERVLKVQIEFTRRTWSDESKLNLLVSAEQDNISGNAIARILDSYTKSVGRHLPDRLGRKYRSIRSLELISRQSNEFVRCSSLPTRDNNAAGDKTKSYGLNDCQSELDFVCSLHGNRVAPTLCTGEVCA